MYTCAPTAPEEIFSEQTWYVFSGHELPASCAGMSVKSGVMKNGESALNVKRRAWYFTLVISSGGPVLFGTVVEKSPTIALSVSSGDSSPPRRECIVGVAIENVDCDLHLKGFLALNTHQTCASKSQSTGKMVKKSMIDG